MEKQKVPCLSPNSESDYLGDMGETTNQIVSQHYHLAFCSAIKRVKGSIRVEVARGEAKVFPIPVMELFLDLIRFSHACFMLQDGFLGQPFSNKLSFNP